MGLFAKIVYSLNSPVILTRSSVLRSIAGCWICLCYFLRFTFSRELFISPSISKNNWTSTVHTNFCSTYILEGFQLSACPNLTTKVPQQYLSYRLEVLVNFGQVLALLLGAVIVELEYSLLIVNVNKCYIMAYLYGTRRRHCIYGNFCKTLVCNCTND